MAFLFWLLWLINASLAIVILYSNSFKSQHSTRLDTDKFVLMSIGLILAGSLIVRYVVKKSSLSVWIVGVPVAFFLLWFIKEELLHIK